MQEKKLKLLINDLGDDCPCKNAYCFLKEFILHLSNDPRMLVQVKCIEKYKFERSKELKYDIGWGGAGKEWVELGYAKKFSEVFDEDKTINKIYKEVMKIKK